MAKPGQKNFLAMSEFIELAIQFEIESAEFYHTLLAKTGRKNVINLLKILAAQEMEHAQILKNYDYYKVSDSILQFGPSLSLSMPAPTTEAPSFAELLTLAIARERTSGEIYQHAADLMSGEFKVLLNGLANFEREHEKKLQALHVY